MSLLSEQRHISDPYVHFRFLEAYSLLQVMPSKTLTLKMLCTECCLYGSETLSVNRKQERFWRILTLSLGGKLWRWNGLTNCANKDVLRRTGMSREIMKTNRKVRRCGWELNRRLIAKQNESRLRTEYVEEGGMLTVTGFRSGKTFTEMKSRSRMHHWGRKLHLNTIIDRFTWRRKIRCIEHEV